MAKVDVGDLNQESGDPKKEVTLTENEVEHVKGGAGYLKIGDIKGETAWDNTKHVSGIHGTTPPIDKKGLKG